jgi:hypothetical protein
MRFVAIDEAGRAAGRGDLGRDDLFGVRAAGGHLDGAEPVLLDVLRIAAELTRREMLRVDAPAALLVQHLGPLVERVGERRADRFRMADAADEFLLRARHHRGADDAGGREAGGAPEQRAAAYCRLFHVILPGSALSGRGLVAAISIASA